MRGAVQVRGRPFEKAVGGTKIKKDSDIIVSNVAFPGGKGGIDGNTSFFFLLRARLTSPIRRDQVSMKTTDDDMDTRIDKIKLSITNTCILNCKYCFVKKGHVVMDESVSKKAVSLIIKSPGIDKTILLYGGEPLLAFDLIQTIVRFARIEAKTHGKNVVISVATNGILIDEGRLDFFKKNGVNLSISIDGDKETHIANRLVGSPYSYENIVDSVKLALDILSPRNVSALVAVTPYNVGNLYKNLTHLRSLGIENFNIEPIQGDGYRWTAMAQEVFRVALDLFMRDVFRLAKNGTFVFLGSVTRALLQDDSIINAPLCSFRENMEVQPSGDIFLSPFSANKAENKEYVVGNSVHGFSARYVTCVFDPDGDMCRNCWKRYGGGVAYSGAQTVDLRNEQSVVFAAALKIIAKKEKMISDYILESGKRIFE